MKTCELLNVSYYFDKEIASDEVNLPQDFLVIGNNDVDMPICQSRQNEYLFLFDSDVEEMLPLAPSIDTFFELVKDFNTLDSTISDLEYSHSVQELLRRIDQNLLNSEFWKSIIEEIELGFI